VTPSTTNRDGLTAQLGDVFREHGFAGATLAELAATTGLKRATLYHHFPGGKAEMAAAVLDAAIAELDERAFSALAGPGTPCQRLDAFVAGFVQYCHGGTRRCVIQSLTTGADAASLMRIRATFDRWTAQLASLFSNVRNPAQAGAAEAPWPTSTHGSGGNVLADLYGALLLSLLRDQAANFQDEADAIAARYRHLLDQRQNAW
jgi:AcrR family transcriptional regulator